MKNHLSKLESGFILRHEVVNMIIVKIGICDWGIGGLGFYQALRQDRPDLSVLYLGDQGFTPYGRASTGELSNRLSEVFFWFRNQGVTEIVVACNAASTVLHRVSVEGVSATGVIAPTLEVLQRETTSVSIIGGRRTIRSGAYRKPLVQAGIKVQQRVAQPLSGLIEAGKGQDSSTHEVLSQILWPIRHSDRLVLACTHYVVLEQVAQSLMPQAKLIDPAKEVWRQLSSKLPAKMNGVGQTDFFTSGNPKAMEEQAWKAFGVTARVNPWS